MDFIRKIYDKYVGKGIWSIGILDNTIEDVVKGKPLSLRRIDNPYKDRWWADPFILEVTEDRILILVEEVFYKITEKGHIALLTVDRNSLKVLSDNVLLELSTHLSFPCILRCGSKIYIYPENGQAGNLSIYEFDSNRNSLQKVGVICDDKIADAVIFGKNDELYLLATKYPYYSENLLELYKYDSEKEKFIHLKKIVFSENIARNAGNVFEIEGTLFRPAQECNQKYGHALSIQKISFENDGIFSFKEVRRILPIDEKFHTGIHTLNSYKSIIVVDHYINQYMIGTVLAYLRNIVRFFIKKK